MSDAAGALECWTGLVTDADQRLEMRPKRLTIPVRGTRYYEAGKAMEAGRLRRGTPLHLVPRPDNPYDSTAVEIRLTDGTMLGHVPRERSAEFFAHVRAGHIANARILRASGIAPRIKIDVQVELSTPVTPPPSRPQPPRSTHQPPPVRAEPQPSTPPGPSPTPPSSNQTTRPPASEESNISWLWWIIAAIILLWLIAS